MKRSAERGFSWKVQTSASDNVQLITIIGKGHPNMFLKIVGALTWNNFNILDAKSFRQDYKTLDVFKVEQIVNGSSSEEHLISAERDLERDIAGDFHLLEKVRKKVIINAQKTSPSKTQISIKNGCLDYTVVNVSVAKDFPGILFLIADTLHQCSVNIFSAQIHTRNGNVQDIFYIRNNDESVLNWKKQADVKAALEKAMP